MSEHPSANVCKYLNGLPHKTALQPGELTLYPLFVINVVLLCLQQMLLLLWYGSLFQFDLDHVIHVVVEAVVVYDFVVEIFSECLVYDFKLKMSKAASQMITEINVFLEDLLHFMIGHYGILTKHIDL